MASASRPAPNGNGDYTARHLQVLEGLEAVRKRPGMYIGSTDQRGLMHCLWEIIDNAVDEALAGVCDHIDVILAADGSIEVRDNGRGIPVDIEPRTGLSGVELVFTKLHAGGKFGGTSYAATGGLHGVGASVVNALSARLDVAVDRGGRTYGMSFRRGEPGVFTDSGPVHSPEAHFAPYEKRSALPVIGKTKRGVTGSRVRFWPDPHIFLKGSVLDYDALIARARQTSFLVPGLRLVIRDERGLPGTPAADGPTEEVFHHDGGITEFVEFLAPDTAITEVWRLQGSGTFKETVPILDNEGHMTPTELERECVVDVALRWGQGYDVRMQSFVNIITTPKGGTHVAGFEQALLKVFRRQLEVNARRLKVGNDKPEKDDILAGMTAVITVRLAEPQFEGQTKEVLGTNAVRSIVAKVVETELTARLTSTKRGDKSQAALLLEKVVSEMKSRISARLHKETQRRKNALESSTLPTKLRDCRTTDVDRSELFIVEGDSAMGTAKEARNSEYQALLPIRGKILNVQKASVSDMLKNAECASIIQVIGAGSGRSFDLAAARYGKVIIMTDADVDGAHIRTLLLTLFFRYMRPLVEAGRVYAAMPPLHRIEVINAGSKKNDLIYTYNEIEMRRTVARLEKGGKKIKQPMQRYKGLGEMNADQLADTTMDPRHRTLRRVTMRDLETAERTFELLMGNEVAPRKDFIIESAAEVDRERIDA
ncbi:type IIA DNA topoisomerase subunit B [Intrasporangium calvum]|uniref:DNA topoisomerase (ATP-hydrolyzing) n=1 Tax=Intrasporangium calvum TaxID=53358 RepID=A0ABT5GIQ3_9MICO|nr:DNA topoisomerase IV subunit B [Intrasporangium calvum]MDC5697841.1 type IIA DNA topoisomerase subunit B [Intrasporangium calvum]